MNGEQPPLALTGFDRFLIVLSHLSVFLGFAIVIPLIVYLVKKPESAVVAGNAREALNFHLSLLIYSLVSVVLCLVFIGFFLVIGVGIFGALFAIIAAVRTSEGAPYHYPLTLRLV